MFKQQTVLILGAGASAPYGYPLGNRLLRNIHEGVSRIAKIRPNYDIQAAELAADPYLSLYQAIGSRRVPFLSPHFLGGEVRDFLTALGGSHQTIDEFARINPRWREFTKLLVALEIFSATVEREEDRFDQYRLRPTLSARGQNQWYGGLVNELKRSAHNPMDLAENQLSVITFNYDHSLEHYLHAELPKGEIFIGFDVENGPEIFHVHGELSFGPLSHVNQRSVFEMILKKTEKFFMIGEERRDGSYLSIAENITRDAEKIFILGFDLHEENVEALGLNEEVIAEKCILLNWDGAAKVRFRAEEAGINVQKNMLSGTSSQPLEISTAITDGLFYHRF